MEYRCSKCSLLVEINERDYTPGTQVKMVCPRCSAEFVIVIPEAEKKLITEIIKPQAKQMPEERVRIQPPEPGFNQPAQRPLTQALPNDNRLVVKPKTYMTEAIIVTVVSSLFCCSGFSTILGIIAIVKAGNVNSAFEAGSHSLAQSSADTAKKLIIWASVIAVIWGIVFWILIIMTDDTV
jgi:DNA-directed RNA polymerase subunit RPC12/RpoP